MSSEVSAIIEQKDISSNQQNEHKQQKGLSSTEISTFGTIFNFITELNNEFGDKQHSLLLFNHFIKKVNLSHVTTVRNIIDIFKTFCIENRSCIQNKDTKLQLTEIRLSEKVYIDMKNVFQISDEETTGVIWSHILAISLQLDPSGRVKELLRQNLNENNTNESNFLTDIISKVEDHIDPNDDNPMNTVNSILKSGVFGDLMSSMSQGLSDGSLDIGKLLGAVQNVTQGFPGASQLGGGNGQLDPLQMLNSVMSGMNQHSSGTQK